MSPTLTRIDELREQYSFEPICRWAVHLYVRHLKKWDSDGYFLDKESAMEHLQHLREHGLPARLRKCERFSSVIEYEEGLYV